MAFTRFFPMPENRSALMAVQTVSARLRSESGQQVANPLYLHGPTGSGKTHLVTALVEEVTRLAPRLIISILQAADLQTSARSPDVSSAEEVDLLRAARNSDLLILEDLQHLGARTPGRSALVEETLVQIFDYLLASQRQMVFTATAGPGQLAHLSARLRSRLGCGLVVGLEPMQAGSRLAFLQEKAQRRQLPLGRAVLAWLADHLVGTGRQLEGALTQLEALSRLRAGSLDVATVAAHFHNQVHLAAPTIERIAQEVGRHFHLEPRHLQSRRRYQNVLLPRQLGMYLARRLTDLSLERIGAYFGGRDHSTVLHACRKIQAALARDATLSGTVGQLHADLG